MYTLLNLLYIYSLLVMIVGNIHITYSTVTTMTSSEYSKLTSHNVTTTRFLTYTVNPSEGFNLRRDVYMRIAVLIQRLNQATQDTWVLVLPPWPHLYHWKSSNIPQHGRPWYYFFNLTELSQFIPIIDYYDFEKLHPYWNKFDTIWYLKQGDFDENIGFFPHMNIIDCSDFNIHSPNRVSSYIYSLFRLSTADKIECYSFLGDLSILIEPLQSFKDNFLLIDHVENILHYDFGGLLFWQARSSMVYSGNLIKIANTFMSEQLNYTLPPNHSGRAFPEIGLGPFLAVHLRRGDYAIYRADLIPSIENALKVIEMKLLELNLSCVFIASDASRSELAEFSTYLGDKMIKYMPDANTLTQVGDGGVAIIDQWIASHATYFIGTHESTFTFRIFEDRELMSVDTKTTFNCFCPDSNPHCEKPIVRKIFKAL